MTVSGFTFIRNGIQFDYPFEESIRSLLPIVDEMVVVVGDSSDQTRERVASIDPGKIRIIDTVWDKSVRTGGRILAAQTNLALKEIRGEWGFYLQGDEVLHEEDYPCIRNALRRYRQVQAIEGLLFNYLHFYGGYSTVGASRQWYRREVRIIRNGIGVQSWGDAQGFRRGGKKLSVAHLPARIFHYGWVKNTEIQKRKLRSFHKFWHPDEWIDRHIPEESSFTYASGGRVMEYAGTHPAVMGARVAAAKVRSGLVSGSGGMSVRDRLLDVIERTTSWRVGEYRNYVISDSYRETPS